MTNLPLMLIVEDAYEVADIIQIAFRKTEMDIRFADGGEEALKIIETQIPDVIILDIAMPQMSGWEFLDILRQAPRAKDIPVIVLTAHLDQTNQRLAEEYQVAAYMQKPIDLNVLRQHVYGYITPAT